MTRKEQSCPKRSCGRKWTYNGSKRKGATVRCPDCDGKVKLATLLVMLAIVTGAGTAYAAQQVLVELPIDRPFETENCVIYGFSETYVAMDCQWIWRTTPEAVTAIQSNPLEVGEDFDVWLEEVIPLVEDNPYHEVESDLEEDAPTTNGTTPQTELEIPKTERDVALDTLDQCLHGIGPWAALVPEQEIEFYQNKTREQFAIKDNLSKNVVVRDILKAIEACDGAREYVLKGNIGAVELNKAAADSLGVDYLGRSENQTFRGNQPSLGYAIENTATKEKIEAEAKRAAEWVCAPERKHLRLCVTDPFTGINRGNSEPIISDSASTGIFLDNRTAIDIMENYREVKAASIITQQDRENQITKAQVFACQNDWESSGRGAISTQWWTDNLLSGFCDDKLESEWLMKHSNNRFDNVKSARDYRLQLDVVIQSGRE
ncbi:hypothetical protein KAR91_03655 [Candidatus Pacearchaeota archaeon]|nr:hypothetical protein [Candidatus Pacearchaeota archaeon]